MGNSTTSKACGKHVWLKTFLFYYGWCLTRITTLWWVLFYFRILYTFSPVGIYIRLHFILLIMFEKYFFKWFFCAFRIVWNTNHVPICVWHVLKAWCLLSVEKIKDVKMRHAIFDCLYLVMFMSINLGETIELFKTCGKEKMMECLIALSLVIHGLNIFGLIANLSCN